MNRGLRAVSGWQPMPGAQRIELQRNFVSFKAGCGARRADAVAVQEQHDLSNHLLLGPLRGDTRRTFWADPGHLAQAIWLLLDDVEHGFAEHSYELLRVDWPEAADHPGAEIFLDPSIVVGGAA